MKHLPRRLLGGTAQKRKIKKTCVGNKVEADLDSDEDDVAVETGGNWVRKNPNLVGSEIPTFIKPDQTPQKADILSNTSTAYEFYKLFQPDSFAEETVVQSKLYAVQKSLKKGEDNMNIDTLRCTEAMLLHSGYHTVPRRRMLWEMKKDCHNTLVANSIRRAEVEAVLSCLHFRDNSLIDTDAYYKVRPIFENLNSNNTMWFAEEEKYSVDEVMIPYFGRHSSKQYIHGKPIRYGFKVWALCTSGGAGVWYEPYCGRDTKIDDKGLGQGPNVVLDLVEKAQIGRGTEVFFDNLFTSFPLLENLSEKGIGGTGTVRQNRLNKVPIINKKEMEKKEIVRGHSDVAYKDDTVLVAWRDSKAVYLASNKHTGDINHKCKRFDRVKRASVQIPIPDMIKAYNESMGGVDLLDAMVAVYRVLYRIKKWWFCFYAWSLSVSAVNAWRLRMCVKEKKEPFLDFLRELVIEMFMAHGTAPYVIRKQPSLQAEHRRFDGLNHWITSTEKDKTGKPSRRNCKQCCLKGKKDAKCLFMCEKCEVPLHTHCFKAYHKE